MKSAEPKSLASTLFRSFSLSGSRALTRCLIARAEFLDTIVFANHIIDAFLTYYHVSTLLLVNLYIRASCSLCQESFGIPEIANPNPQHSFRSFQLQAELINAILAFSILLGTAASTTSLLVNFSINLVSCNTTRFLLTLILSRSTLRSPPSTFSAYLFSSQQFDLK